MRRLVNTNFIVSVWFLIGYCVVFAGLLMGRTEWLQAMYGPFSARVMLWPLAIATIELVLWFVVFRDRRHGDRLMAGFVGLMLLLQPILVNLLVADLYDRPVNWFRWWFFVYVAVSHLAYAFTTRRSG